MRPTTVIEPVRDLMPRRALSLTEAYAVAESQVCKLSAATRVALSYERCRYWFRLSLYDRFVDPVCEDAESSQVMKGFILGRLGKWAVFMSKNIPDRFEATLTECKCARVKILVGIAAVVGHEAQPRASRFRRIQAKALANELDV